MGYTEWASLAGGLGIFIFGMKMMSESLQLAAGERMRSILGKMTRNRLAAVFSGFIITSFLQSSSATTVMIVGFVNAGLLTLLQAIGVIMGANIGTTITAWIVSLLGFKVHVSAFALPIIAIGVVFHFVKNQKVYSWGNALIGFGLLFLGLDFFKNAVPDVAKNPDTFKFLAQYAGKGFLSLIIFIGIGTFITIIIQSSSATMAITITLAYTGHIGYESAIGMVLGENIGTTITANLAALAGNLNSKKTALAHTVFNLIGVVWVVILLQPILMLMEYLIGGDPHQNKEITRYYISMFHTGFNVTNTLLLIWFVPQMAHWISKIGDFLIKETLEEGQRKRFIHITGGTVDTSEFSLMKIQEYSLRIIRDALKSFKDIENLLLNGYNEGLVKSIQDNEERMDFFRNEMIRFVEDILKKGNHARGPEIYLILERVKVMEEIGDIFDRIARKIRKIEKEHFYSLLVGKRKVYIIRQIEVLRKQYGILREVLDHHADEQDRQTSLELRRMVKAIYQSIQKKIQKDKDDKKITMTSRLLYLDLARLLDNLSYHLKLMVDLDRK